MLKFAEDGTIEVPVHYFLIGAMGGWAYKEVYFLHSSGKHIHIRYPSGGTGILSGSCLSERLLAEKADLTMNPDWR